MDAKVAEYPLAIDLDGTLLRVDSLIEMFVVNLLRQPLATLVALLALVRGRAAFKKHMVEINLGDVTRFPIHSEFMAYLLEQKASGRSLFLVTAADQEMADTIARKLGIFSGAAGSTDGHNLKGTSKLSYLQERFPDGFSYAGDSPADLPIWQEAKSIVLVGVSNRVRKAVARMQRPIEQEFQADTINPGIWFKALRAHQWSKNLLMFVPLILSHKYSDPAAVTHVALAFIYMSLIASGTYLINDLSDLDSDRAHPTKRNRAVASGTVGAGTALTIALSCIVAGLIGALSLSKLFLLLLLVYVAITLAYSFYIKRIAMLDVVTLGALYMLRVMMGTVVLPVALSPWLLMFSLFFFLGFSLAKRYVEIAAGGEYYGA